MISHYAQLGARRYVKHRFLAEGSVLHQQGIHGLWVEIVVSTHVQQFNFVRVNSDPPEGCSLLRLVGAVTYTELNERSKR